MKISAKNRRLRNKDVKLLLKKAKKLTGKSFIFFITRNQFLFCRSAAAISAKLIKKASERNLIRRRVKASLLEAERNLLQDKGFDVLIVLKTKEPPAYIDLRTEIFELFQKLK